MKNKLKKAGLIILSIFVALILMMVIMSQSAIKKDPPIRYVNKLPGDIFAITLPPFGVLIEREYINEGREKGSTWLHEMIHWQQYQRYGVLGFYGRYIKDWMRFSYEEHPMEVEARLLSE